MIRCFNWTQEKAEAAGGVACAADKAEAAEAAAEADAGLRARLSRPTQVEKSESSITLSLARATWLAGADEHHVRPIASASRPCEACFSQAHGMEESEASTTLGLGRTAWLAGAGECHVCCTCSAP